MKSYDLIWLIPILPLLGAIFNGLVSNRLGLSKSVTNAVALLGSGLAWLLGWGAIVQWILDLGIHHTHVVRLFSWIQGGSLRILASTAVSPRSTSRPPSSSMRCRR